MIRVRRIDCDCQLNDCTKSIQSDLGLMEKFIARNINRVLKSEIEDGRCQPQLLLNILHFHVEESLDSTNFD